MSTAHQVSFLPPDPNKGIVVRIDLTYTSVVDVAHPDHPVIRVALGSHPDRLPHLLRWAGHQAARSIRVRDSFDVPTMATHLQRTTALTPMEENTFRRVFAETISARPEKPVSNFSHIVVMYPDVSGVEPRWQDVVDAVMEQHFPTHLLLSRWSLHHRHGSIDIAYATIQSLTRQDHESFERHLLNALRAKDINMKTNPQFTQNFNGTNYGAIAQNVEGSLYAMLPAADAEVMKSLVQKALEVLSESTSPNKASAEIVVKSASTAPDVPTGLQVIKSGLTLAEDVQASGERAVTLGLKWYHMALMLAASTPHVMETVKHVFSSLLPG
jgi:hypothetical protein